MEFFQLIKYLANIDDTNLTKGFILLRPNKTSQSLPVLFPRKHSSKHEITISDNKSHLNAFFDIEYLIKERAKQRITNKTLPRLDSNLT